MKYSKIIRSLVDQAVPEEVEAMVLLTLIAGSSRGHDGGGSELGYDAEGGYARKHGLDPDSHVGRMMGAWGLLAALGETNVHFLFSGGRMRNDPAIMLASSEPRDRVVLRHERGGVPPIAHRVMHFTFDAGRYYVGSSFDGRLSRNEINNTKLFLERWGPTAIDNKA